jgi:hypothetical protein
MESVAPRAAARPEARLAAGARSGLPWTLYAAVLGSTSIVAGLLWDISWHSTIGRDTFWTPAHMAIYLGGVLAGGAADLPAAAAAVPAAGSAPAPAPGAEAPTADPDDSWLTATPEVGGPGAVADLGDGYTMTWLPAGAPAVAGRDGDLRFAVRDPGGRPAAVEPYMGMLSHAAIRRDDGQVFVHLHSQGTVSMAAQQVFARHEARPVAAMPSRPGMPDMAMSMRMPETSADGALRFPYGFPQPGRYRVWVQVRTGGRVRTGVFETRISAG